VDVTGGADGMTRWEVTIARALSDVGYATGMWGKWHLGSDPEHRRPVDFGFDEAVWSPRGHRAVRPRTRPPEDATCRRGRSGIYQRHLKMFTAREITSTPTMSEIASSVITISFIHGLIADTSGGLTDVAVEKAKWK